MDQVRIALLDWDSDVKNGRRLIIESQPKYKVVFEGSGSSDDLDKVFSSLVDVLLIDQVLESGSGIDFYTRLRGFFASSKDVPKAVLTAPFTSPLARLEALEAGFYGFVGLDEGADALIEMVDSISKAIPATTLNELWSLIDTAKPQSAIDVDLINLVREFSDNRNQILNRLRNSWKRLSEGQRAEWNTRELDNLMNLAGYKTPAELVIKLYRNGFLDEH